MELIVVFSFNGDFIHIMVLLNKTDANGYRGMPKLSSHMCKSLVQGATTRIQMEGPAGIDTINVTCGLQVEGTVSLVKPHNILSFMPPEFYITGLSLNDIRCTVFPSVSNLAFKVL